MADENGLTIERIINAPREKVWQAWTDPEMVKRWWGPEGFTAPSAKIDLRVGGKYIYCMHGPKDSQWDRDMYSAGVYKAIVPNEKLLVTDYFSDSEGNKVAPSSEGMDGNMPEEMEVTVRFEDAGKNKTRLVIEYPRPMSEEQFDAMKKSGMVDGWNSSLNKLQSILE